MIPKTITDIIEIFIVSFAVVLLAVRLLPKEKTTIVKMATRRNNPHRAYKKIRKAS
jgi:hypothetical protein